MRAFDTQGRNRGLALFLLSALLAIGLALSAVPIAAAEGEVECSSIRVQMKADGYDTTCEDGKGLDHAYQTLEANSTDGTHFLVIGDLTTNNGYIFNGGSLREGLTDAFESLEPKDWHSGKGEQGLTTAEFVSEYKSMDSACVGFQKYVRREPWGGWRRHIIGFGCSRVGDRSQVYQALKLVDFPN